MAIERTVVGQAGEPEMISGFLLEPMDRTITLVELPLIPGAAAVDPRWIVDVLGTKTVVQVELVPGEALIAAVPERSEAWRYAASCPIDGTAVVVGYDRTADRYQTSALSLQRVAELVAFADEAPAEEEEAA